MLTDRVLAAENVTTSETTVIKARLSPVVGLDLPMIGALSDAQEPLVKAIAELWPESPHQTCQFHDLREAADPIYNLDRSTRKAMRKDIQSKVRETRKQLSHHLQTLQEASQPEQQQEREQLAVLADDALSIQTALNFEGVSPFVYPGIQA